MLNSVTRLLDPQPSYRPILDQLPYFKTLDPEQSRRLFNGRGQCYEGLEFINIDWYKPVLFITVYKEVETLWLEGLVEQLAGEMRGPASICVVVQRRYLPGAPSEVLYGVLPEQVYAKEGELLFELTFCKKQNIGFFLDASPGRDWLKTQASGKHVLNLFAYTCSFSVAALASGASSVINLDMSQGALLVGKQNHRLNAFGQRMVQDVHFLSHDLFRSWAKVERKGPYDLIIVDPPSYQRGSFVAEKDYQRVIRRLPKLVKTGAELLLCLNSPNLTESYLRQLVADHTSLQFVERIANRLDFPEADEQRSLKMLRFRV